MAAGMHHARAWSRHARSRSPPASQRVHVGAQPDARVPWPARSTPTTPVRPMPRCTSMPQRFQPLGDQGGGAVLLEAGLGMGVEVAPPGGQLVLVAADMLDRVKSLSCPRRSRRMGPGDGSSSGWGVQGGAPRPVCPAAMCPGSIYPASIYTGSWPPALDLAHGMRRSMDRPAAAQRISGPASVQYRVRRPGQANPAMAPPRAAFRERIAAPGVSATRRSALCLGLRRPQPNPMEQRTEDAARPIRIVPAPPGLARGAPVPWWVKLGLKLGLAAIGIHGARARSLGLARPSFDATPRPSWSARRRAGWNGRRR